jgi:hypothetical protein
MSDLLRARNLIMSELGLITVASKKFYGRFNKGLDEA